MTCALLFVVRSKNVTSSNTIINQKGLENIEDKEESSSNEKEDSYATTTNTSNKNNGTSIEPESNTGFEGTKEPNNDSDAIANNHNVQSTQSNQTEQTNDTITSTTSSNTKHNKFKVVFKDYDGKVLKTEEIEKGKNAIPPNVPKRKGFIFEKWNISYENVQTDIVTTANYKEITKPTLVLETTSNKNEVVVKVFIYKNPGLLALVINNTFDEDVLELEKFESGEVMGGYVFTPPKNIKSGCNYAWNTNEVPEKAEEGEVLTLHYKIKKPIKTSLPPISISCYDGAFDENYELIDFEIIT